MGEVVTPAPEQEAAKDRLIEQLEAALIAQQKAVRKISFNTAMQVRDALEAAAKFKQPRAHDELTGRKGNG